LAKPAARIGDQHECPKVTPGTPPVPHVGGAVSIGVFRDKCLKLAKFSPDDALYNADSFEYFIMC